MMSSSNKKLTLFISLPSKLAKVRRPEVDTHTLRNGTLTEHNFADTINLLLSIGEQTVTAIYSNVPVSPFPYNVSTDMDVDSRIKVLTRRITVHKSEIPYTV
jgi:hypothetical protein